MVKPDFDLYQIAIDPELGAGDGGLGLDICALRVDVELQGVAGREGPVVGHHEITDRGRARGHVTGLP